MKGWSAGNGPRGSAVWVERTVQEISFAPMSILAEVTSRFSAVLHDLVLPERVPRQQSSHVFPLVGVSSEPFSVRTNRSVGDAGVGKEKKTKSTK